ncbi:MAG: hypothetical protein LBD99_01135 [Candidatus Margulisbacteria bacterium]|jgi:hypothetical protein|nr:hypothetical protein [Candidatus Margulisiibacteriota bacterium]
MRPKLIAGFEPVNKSGLTAELKQTDSAQTITILNIGAGSRWRHSSALDARYSSIQNDLIQPQGSNAVRQKYPDYGLHFYDLAAIAAQSGIAQEKINYVLGGNNLFWQQTDSVYCRGSFYRRHISEDSVYMHKSLYYFTCDNYGRYAVDLYDPFESGAFAACELAVSGRPVVLPYAAERFREKDLLEQGTNYGIPSTYDSAFRLDTARSAIIFPQGLRRAVYPHNVLAVDDRHNAYLVRFHGRSVLKGPAIEDMQGWLRQNIPAIQAALVTSNGEDVFLFDARERLYYSESRSLDSILANETRRCQHLLFVYED